MSMKNDGYGAGKGGAGWARVFRGGGIANVPKVDTAKPLPNMGRRAVIYRPDHDSFGAFMKSDQMRDATVEAAQDIARRARELAPRQDPPSETPMADQFEVNEDAGFIKVSGNVRVKVEVFNPDRAAAPNEFGSKRNKRHRMLARAGAEHGEFKPDGGLGQ